MIVLLPSLLSCVGSVAPSEPVFECPVPVTEVAEFSEWSAAGKPIGGDVFWMEFHPDVSQRIVAGSSMNGLYISEDSGQTWEKQVLPTSHIIGEISFNPDEPEQFATVIEGGLFAGIFDTEEGVQSIAAEHPEEVIFHGILWRENEILATDEKGDLWSRPDWDSPWVLRGQITEVVAPPPHESGGNSGPLYNDYRHIYLEEVEGTLYAIQHDTGLFRSNDQGETWELILEGPLHSTALTIQDGVLWIGGSRVLYTSSDQGETWREYNVGNIEVQSVLLLSEQIIVVGQYSVYLVTEDSVDSLGPLPEVHYLTNGIVTDEGVLISDRDGFFISDKDFQEWTFSNEGLIANDLGAVYVHPACPNIMWTGTVCENGLYRSDDYGSTLEHVDEYFHYVMDLRVRPQNLYELWVVSDYSLKRSYNLGVTWEEIIPGDVNVHFHGFDMHPSSPDHLLVGTVGGAEGVDNHDFSGRVFRSDDGGETWQDSSTGIPQNQASMNAIHFMNQNPDVVLLGTYDGGDELHSFVNTGIGLYRSVDTGRSWRLVETEFQLISTLTECNSIVYASTEKGVYRSMDEGLSWSLMQSGEDVVAIDCWEDTVILLADDGVSRSVDQGASWISWSEGLSLPSDGISRLSRVTISKDGNTVYVSIPNVGLLRRSL